LTPSAGRLTRIADGGGGLTPLGLPRR